MLTQRQQSILDYIIEFKRRSGQTPTYREIAAVFDIKSTNGVRRHITALIKKGIIYVRPYEPRGIRVYER